MAWVQWDNVKGEMTSVVAHLPDSVVNLPVNEQHALGYRQLVIVYPEDMITRFQRLLGGARFDLQPDGTVKQWYPNADFSVAAVRNALHDELSGSLQQTLGRTDWAVIRKMDIGAPVPENIVIVRQKQRDHYETVKAQIDAATERELVEMRWTWPTQPAHVMIGGVPTLFSNTMPIGAPAPDSLDLQPGAVRPRQADASATVPDPTAPSDQVPPGGFYRDPETGQVVQVAQHQPPPSETYGLDDYVVPNSKRAVLNPPPPTTDGPVPHKYDPTIPPHHTAENVPRPTRD